MHINKKIIFKHKTYQKQLGKIVPVTKPDDLWETRIKAMWWKERMDSHTVSSDTHVHGHTCTKETC